MSDFSMPFDGVRLRRLSVLECALLLAVPFLGPWESRFIEGGKCDKICEKKENKQTKNKKKGVVWDIT